MKKGYKPKTSTILESDGDKLITYTSEILKTRKLYFSDNITPDSGNIRRGAKLPRTNSDNQQTQK